MSTFTLLLYGVALLLTIFVCAIVLLVYAVTGEWDDDDEDEVDQDEGWK